MKTLVLTIIKGTFKWYALSQILVHVSLRVLFIIAIGIGVVTILAVKKVGHLNIKTKMFYFEAHVLSVWLSRVLASQPIRMCV